MARYTYTASFTMGRIFPPRAIFAAAALLACLFCATSCRHGNKPPLPGAEAADEPFSFAAAWGTDLKSGGNLSGPAAVIVLKNKHLIVLDRFNRRVQEYFPDGLYLGEWGRAPDGGKFPFTTPVDMAEDPATGDIIVGVLNRISDQDLRRLRGGLFPADTFPRFSQDGAFKGDAALVEELNVSPANNANFVRLIDNVYWNRNELLPMSLFGSIAVNTKYSPDVWQTLMGPLQKASFADGSMDKIPLTENGKKAKEICELDTDGGGWLYMTGCLQRAEIYRIGIADVRKEKYGVKFFIKAPENTIFEATADTRTDIFKRLPSGGFALYFVLGNSIFLYGPSGERSGEIKISVPIQYATDLASDGLGGFYIADYVEDCVLHIGPDGRLLRRIGTDRSAPGQFGGRSFTLFLKDPDKGELSRPAGVISVAADPSGNVYATDAGNHRVQKFAPGGKFLAAFYPCKGYVGPCYPTDVVYAGNSVYVSLYGAHTVARLDPAGRVLASWKLDKPSATAPCSLCGMGADPAGNIYVTDGESIYKLGPDLIPAAGWNKDAFKLPFLSNPNDIAIDETGSFYVAGTKGAGIFAIASSVCKFTSSLKLDRCFKVKSLYHPRSVAAAGGRVFIANSGRDTVIQLTYDGTPVNQFGGEGRGTGMLQNPLGLSADAKGNLYVADNGNERIEQFKIKY